MASRIAIDGGLFVRHATPSDTLFLRDLYASTRAAELAMLAWDNEMKWRFVDHQFHAQDVDYRGRHPNGEFLVVEDADGTSIGRIYVSDLGDELRVLDVIVHERLRSRGYGTALMRWVLARADVAGQLVSLHVERANPAFRLYERLGFEAVSGNDLHLRMERRPIS
ncbi:MAG TPA: GNAT family N-acetyltransferase [Acidimicrobiales bacterium]